MLCSSIQEEAARTWAVGSGCFLSIKLGSPRLAWGVWSLLSLSPWRPMMKPRWYRHRWSIGRLSPTDHHLLLHTYPPYIDNSIRNRRKVKNSIILYRCQVTKLLLLPLQAEEEWSCWAEWQRYCYRKWRQSSFHWEKFRHSLRHHFFYPRRRHHHHREYLIDLRGNCHVVLFKIKTFFNKLHKFDFEFFKFQKFTWSFRKRPVNLYDFQDED